MIPNLIGVALLDIVEGTKSVFYVLYATRSALIYSLFIYPRHCY